jgi:hypothetical protein
MGQLGDEPYRDVRLWESANACAWRFLSDLESVALLGSGVVATFRASRHRFVP